MGWNFQWECLFFFSIRPSHTGQLTYAECVDIQVKIKGVIMPLSTCDWHHKQWAQSLRYVCLYLPRSCCTLYLSAVLTPDAIWITSLVSKDSNHALGLAPHVRRSLAAFQSGMWLMCFKKKTQQEMFGICFEPNSYNKIVKTVIVTSENLAIIRSGIFSRLDCNHHFS